MNQKMNVYKRGMILLTFFGCCFCLSLLAAALSTQFWYQATCRQYVDTSQNTSSSTFRQKAYGKIHFGLFHGQKMLNWGIGDRITKFNVKSKLIPRILEEKLWMSSIAFLGGSICFSVIAAIFAIINTATSPIECISRTPGLYLWNFCAGVLGMGSLVCWGLQYHFNLRDNILLDEASDGWTTAELQSLGYSYWLVAVAVGINVTNCILIHLANQKSKVRNHYEQPEMKPGNIMLY